MIKKVNIAFFLVFALLIPLHKTFSSPVKFSMIPDSLKEEILALEPKIKETDYNEEQIDQIVKKIRLLKRVEHVGARLINDQWELFFHLSQRVEKIQILGNNFLKDGEIQSIINVSIDDVFKINSIIDGVEELRLAYKRNGFLNPSLDLETPTTTNGNIELVFKIKEGPQTLINTWKVASDNSILNQKIEVYLKRKFSGPYTDDKLREARDWLLKELRDQYYLQASLKPFETRFSADETKADITIHIENPTTFVLDFFGAKEISASVIEKNILDLKNFSTSNPDVVLELQNKIEQAYLKRGFARIQIKTIVDTTLDLHKKKLTFLIEEGPRVKIEKVEFAGSLSKNHKHYEEQFYKSATPLIQERFYNREDLEDTLKNLALNFQNEGYLTAKILSSRTQFNKDKTKIKIILQINEGPLTIIEDVSFSGNISYNNDDLRRVLPLQMGEPLRLMDIEKSLVKLKQYYREQAYLEVKILNEKDDLVVYNSDNTKAKLNFKIQEGPQVKVGSILIDGNNFTKDYVILNELDFVVGDNLTPNKIEESVSRLQRGGHFGSVDIRTLEENTNVSLRTVIIKVSERNPGVFTVGLGATNERELTLRGYTGIGYRNLLGTGRGLSLRLEGNYNVKDIKFLESKVTISYLEPFIFSTRNRGRVIANRQKTVADYTTKKITEANQVTWSIERDFSSHFFGAWDFYSLTTFNDFYLDDVKPPSKLDIATTSFRLDIDYRNNPFNPTSGHLVKFSTDYSSPNIGNTNCDEFYRGSALYNFYLGFFKQTFVWANSLRGGYLQSTAQGRQSGIPYDKVGFILGGRSTIRGYEAGTSEVFPNSKDIDPTGATALDTYRLTTDAKMGLLKSELRFPLWSEWLGGAVFYDGGTVQISGLQFNDYYRDSLGVGIHINTPVGPINLEFAWKLDRKAGEEPNRIHLSVGTF